MLQPDTLISESKKIAHIFFGGKMKPKLHAEKTDIYGKSKDNSVTIRSKKGQKIDKELRILVKNVPREQG